MTCPRCQCETDRRMIRSPHAPCVLAMQVKIHEPLICTRCLTDWALRRVTGTLMILPPKGNPMPYNTS